MPYVLEPSHPDVLPNEVEYNNINIKFKEMYTDVKSNIDKHLDSRVDYWSSMEKKYNVDEPGITAPSPNRDPDDTSDDESEEINWPKQMWALYLTSVEFYKKPSKADEFEQVVHVELSESDLSDFDVIYEEIMNSSVTAQTLSDDLGY